MIIYMTAYDSKYNSMIAKPSHGLYDCLNSSINTEQARDDAMKPVYNDHIMWYLSAFWSSSRWPLAT